MVYNAHMDADDGPRRAQLLMLLRRFPILNDLPLKSLQAQGLAKGVIQVGSSWS